jgi:hypothetical protein
MERTRVVIRKSNSKPDGLGSERPYFSKGRETKYRERDLLAGEG